MRLSETEGIPGARAIACPIFNTAKKLLGSAVIMGILPDDRSEMQRLAERLLNAIKGIHIN